MSSDTTFTTLYLHFLEIDDPDGKRLVLEITELPREDLITGERFCRFQQCEPGSLDAGYGEERWEFVHSEKVSLEKDDAKSIQLVLELQKLWGTETSLYRVIKQLSVSAAKAGAVIDQPKMAGLKDAYGEQAPVQKRA